MLERRFGDLIVTGAEIPAWAESLVEVELGEARLQPSCLKMWIQLRIKPASVAAVMLKAQIHGVTALWDVLGDPAVTPGAIPVGLLLGVAGCWGSLGMAVLLQRVAREVGGTRGGGNQARWQAHGKHPQGSLWESASHRIAGTCWSLRLWYNLHVATLTIAFFPLVCLFILSFCPFDISHIIFSAFWAWPWRTGAMKNRWNSLCWLRRVGGEVDFPITHQTCYSLAFVHYPVVTVLRQGWGEPNWFVSVNLLVN